MSHEDCSTSALPLTTHVVAPAPAVAVAAAVAVKASATVDVMTAWLWCAVRVVRVIVVVGAGVATAAVVAVAAVVGEAVVVAGGTVDTVVGAVAHALQLRGQSSFTGTSPTDKSQLPLSASCTHVASCFLPS